MVDRSKQAVLDEARETLARLREQTARFHERIEPDPAAFVRPPQPEPPRRAEPKLDTSPINWAAMIEQRLTEERIAQSTDVKELAMFLATETAEALSDLRQHFEEKLAAQAEAFNLRIDTLSKELDRRAIELHLRLSDERIERNKAATAWADELPGVKMGRVQ